MTITVSAAPNAAPVAAGDNYSVQEGRTLKVSGPGVLGNDSDPDGDAILADQFTQGTNGSVTIEVVEGTPLATTDSYSVQQGQTLIVAVPGLLANDSDPNGDPVVAELLTQAANGFVTLASDGVFTYTPNAGYAGTDSFTYRISDGFGGTDEAVVTINVTSTNSAPVIAPVGAVPAEEDDVAGIDDDAVHAVGYLGDADGNRSYGAKDPFLLQNVVAARESGFGAWALTDPTVVGDIVAAAGLNVLDVLRLQQHVIALAHNPSAGLPEFPPIVPLGSLSVLALSTLPAPAEQPLAPPMELAGTKVNWEGRFAPNETTPNVAATGVAAAGTSVDWMNSPWARDLTDRLATSHAQAESASKSVLPGRELLRTLTRAFARR